ncbi:hypothetical protein [Catenulispora subtropica]
MKLFTAAATVLVAAACSSSGTVGVGGGGKINLDRVSAADAIKDASAAQIAKHSVKEHLTYTSQRLTQSVDSLQRTDRATLESTVVDQVTGATQSTHGEVRLDGSVAYVDNPEIPAAMRQNKQWIKLDLDHLPPRDSSDKNLALFAALGASYRGADPVQGSLFALAYPDLHRVGVETRDGRRLLHLAASVTPDTLPATPPPGSGITQAYLDLRRTQWKDQGLTKMSVDFWMGEDGLAVEVKQAESGTSGDSTGDMTQSDWGVPVTIVAPPADQTYTVPAQ